jgi:ABC-type branched-subunit amino acid transport system permease subunit
MITYLVTILTLLSISILVGFALNLQWGLCGLVNFGLAGLFCLGAYACALVALAGGGALLAVGAAMLVVALACAALALLTLRLSNEYLAIMSLGLSEVVRLLALGEGWLTGGALGLPGIPRPFAEFVPGAQYGVFFLLLCLLAVVLVFAVLERLTLSPFGRVLRALREDETVAATLGKPVLRLRVIAFALGGAIIGLAGALHAFYFTYIDPSQFTPILTAFAFMAVVAGGRGSHSGLLLGAMSIMLLVEGTRFLKDWIDILDASQLAAVRMIAIGAGLILLLIYRPQGLRAEYRLRVEPEKEVCPPVPFSVFNS